MNLGRSLPTPALDLGLLLARVMVGVVLIAHGWQKLDVYALYWFHFRIANVSRKV